MFKSFYGSSLLGIILLAGCSKTNPNIQLKERVVERDLKTYDALTATNDMQVTSEKNLDEVISKIRNKRHVGFDWKTFWIRVSENINPLKMETKTSANLFSLSKLSCEEAPETSYTILQFAEKGFYQASTVSSEVAEDWLKFFINVSEDCVVAEENAFIFRYKSVIESIVKSGNKNLKLLVISDLNTRAERTRNPLLLKEVRSLFKGNQSFFSNSSESYTIKETILLAHAYNKLFPYRSNPYLEQLITDTKSTGPEYLDDLGEAFTMLSKIEIPNSKIPAVTNTMITTWSKNTLFETASDEESMNFFTHQYHAADVIFALLEKELSFSKHKHQVLKKGEELIRGLETSLFNLSHAEDAIMKNGQDALNVMLDLRHSKRTGRSLILDSSPVEKISKLSEVFKTFHRTHQNEDAKSHIKLFCDWIGTNKVESLGSDTVTNGCFEVIAKDSHQKLKVVAENLKTGMFSVLKYSGDLSIEAKTFDLAVIDLSQTQIPERSKPRYSKNLEPIVFPLFLGFELSENFLNLKKDKLYFFPYHFIYRPASNGLAHEQSSKDGYRGGNLHIKVQNRSTSFSPTFVSEGGLPAETLPENNGGKSVSYSMDLFSLEEWLSSSAQGESYPLDILSTKNLKNLFNKMKRTNENKTVVKIEPDFINHLGPSAKTVFHESLKLSREAGKLTSDNYLEELANQALFSLTEDLDNKIYNGDTLGTLPYLGPSIRISGGTMSSVQSPGIEGAKGKVLYE